MMDRETAIEKVLIHLAETRGQWRIDDRNNLRRVCHDRDELHVMCPLTSLEGGLRKIGDYNKSAENLGISRGTAAEIVYAADLVSAADGNRDDDLSDLRTQMLAAAGLTERAAEESAS